MRNARIIALAALGLTMLTLDVQALDCTILNSPERLRKCIDVAIEQDALPQHPDAAPVPLPRSYPPSSGIWQKHKEQVERSQATIDQIRNEYRERYRSGSLEETDKRRYVENLAEQIDKQRRSIQAISGDRQSWKKAGLVEAKDALFSVETDVQTTWRREAAERLHAISQCDGCGLEGKSISEIEKMLGPGATHPRHTQILQAVNLLGVDIARLQGEYEALSAERRATPEVRRDYEEAVSAAYQKIRYELHRLGAPAPHEYGESPSEAATRRLDAIDTATRRDARLDPSIQHELMQFIDQDQRRSQAIEEHRRGASSQRTLLADQAHRAAMSQLGATARSVQQIRMLQTLNSGSSSSTRSKESEGRSPASDSYPTPPTIESPRVPGSGTSAARGCYRCGVP